MRLYFYRYIFSPVLLLFVTCHIVQGADFKATDINGNLQHLSEFRGKWVVVNFWATWCEPCLEEIPDLINFHFTHKDKDAVVLGINYGDNITENELRHFVARVKINYPVLISNQEVMKNIGPVTGLPTTYLIKPTGEIAAWIEGAITTEQIEEFISNTGINHL